MGGNYTIEKISANCTVHQCGKIKIIETDLFEFDFTQFAPFDLIFDRASLIAINWEDRERYVDLMISLLGENLKKKSYFLQGMDYKKGEHLGPPHIFDQACCDHFFKDKIVAKHLDRLFAGVRFNNVECWQDLWILGGQS